VNPPDHITGTLINAPAHIRAERDAWAAQQAIAGHSTSAIGFALGIGQASAYRAALRGGWVMQHKPPRNPLRSAGVRYGTVKAAFAAMPPRDQDRAVNEAMRSGQTLADVLSRAYAKRIEP